MTAHMDAVTGLAIDPHGLYILSGSKFGTYELTRGQFFSNMYIIIFIGQINFNLLSACVYMYITYLESSQQHTVPPVN